MPSGTLGKGGQGILRETQSMCVTYIGVDQGLRHTMCVRARWPKRRQKRVLITMPRHNIVALVATQRAASRPMTRFLSPHAMTSARSLSLNALAWDDSTGPPAAFADLIKSVQESDSLTDLRCALRSVPGLKRVRDSPPSDAQALLLSQPCPDAARH